MMNICRLCLKKENDLENIFNEIRNGVTMAYVIGRHFWFEPQKDDKISTVICKCCWIKVSDFHEFYIVIENAQNLLKGNILKNENAKARCCSINEIKVNRYVAYDKIIEMDEMAFNFPTDIMEELISKESGVKAKDVLSNNLGDNEIENHANTNYNEFDGKKLRVKSDLDRISECDKYSQFEKKTSSSRTEMKSESKLSRPKYYPGIRNRTKEDKKIITTTKKRGRPKKYEVSNKSLITKQNENYKAKIKEYDAEIAQYMSLYCDVCNKKSENFPALKIHMRDEHDIKDGYVICCDKKFNKRALLLYHIRQHLNPSCYRCEECDFTFSDRQSRHNHFLVKHQKDEDKIFACFQCSKKFVRKYLLEQHKSFSHRDFIPKCKNCGKRFKTIEELNKHSKESCYPGTMCDICAKCIRGTAAFKKHQLEHQGVTLPKVQCDVCGLWYKDKRGLERHKRKHLESKESHICDICEKLSPSRSAMLSHKRYAHGTDRIYKCSVCQKTFKKPISLREHMTIHTGEILYNCPYCPRTFNSNANMHSHRKKVHPKEFEETRKQRKQNFLLGD